MEQALGMVEERIAVVTGASSGIGQALSRELGRCGHILHLLGRDIPRLRQVCEAAPAGSSLYAAEFADGEELACLAKQLAGRLSRIDVLIHCAGTFAAGGFEGLEVADFDRQWMVNVRAPFMLTKVLLPALRSTHGQVVFINSSAGLGLHGSQGASGYAATKHALKALADGLRAEVNVDGVRVLSVYPGRTATAMQESIHARDGRPYHPEELLQPDDVVAAVMAALRLPRTAELTDIILRPMRKGA
jgi:NAD(P)-dependent dehydrogenase (short-subunit alcohol dehydrogenase family)